MNIVNLGPLRIECGEGQSALDLIEGLLRHLNNKEIGVLLGISERTVRRWKCSGRLPNRDSEQVSLLELLVYLIQIEGGSCAEVARQTMTSARTQ